MKIKTRERSVLRRWRHSSAEFVALSGYFPSRPFVQSLKCKSNNINNRDVLAVQINCLLSISGASMTFVDSKPPSFLIADASSQVSDKRSKVIENNGDDLVG